MPLLPTRCGLIGAVVFLAASGLSQVLCVRAIAIAGVTGAAVAAPLVASAASAAATALLPFTAYFAFGRTTALALGALCLAGPLTAYVLTAPRWYGDPERVSDLLMLTVGLVLTISMAAVVGPWRAAAAGRAGGSRGRSVRRW
ncbi:hypothetical protein AB0I77_06365 [Streptomyces sp. NPDC050619]|uniref:hypothetical protein n=1 Tax=Streptomyces sp. NPDC050619 TaxID=3157214 RepID=UPI00343069E3